MNTLPVIKFEQTAGRLDQTKKRYNPTIKIESLQDDDYTTDNDSSRGRKVGYLGNIVATWDMAGDLWAERHGQVKNKLRSLGALPLAILGIVTPGTDAYLYAQAEGSLQPIKERSKSKNGRAYLRNINETNEWGLAIIPEESFVGISILSLLNYLKRKERQKKQHNI